MKRKHYIITVASYLRNNYFCVIKQNKPPVCYSKIRLEWASGNDKGCALHYLQNTNSLVYLKVTDLIRLGDQYHAMVLDCDTNKDRFL